MFKRILIAIDESEPATRAYEVGMGLANALGAQVGLIHVIDPMLAVVPDGGGVGAEDLRQSLREAGTAFLESAQSRATGQVEPEILLREGRPAEEIVAAVYEWGAQLLVLGSHGRKGLERLLVGSTADSVIRHAPCPVLLEGPALVTVPVESENESAMQPVTA